MNIRRVFSKLGNKHGLKYKPRKVSSEQPFTDLLTNVVWFGKVFAHANTCVVVLSFLFMLEHLLYYNTLSSLLTVPCIPSYLCVVRPIVRQYIPGMLKRMGAGMAVALLALLYTFLSSVITQATSPDTLMCNFTHVESVSNSSSIRLVFEGTSYQVIISILVSLMFMLTYIAQYEFICSQSPHFMKGFLIGLSVSLSGVFTLVATIVTYLFSLVHLSFPDCGFIYYLTNIVLGLISLLVYTCVAKKYKYRKRDNICHVYRYVIEYYSKVVQQRYSNRE